MNYQEAKDFLYIGGDREGLSSGHKQYLIGELQDAIGRDDVIEGLKLIVQLTKCDENTAKLLWVDLCQDFGAEYRSFYEKQLKKQQSQKQYVPKCPTCGSPDIQKISGTKRWVTTGLFGVASGDLGKTMVCKNCGYKW